MIVAGIIHIMTIDDDNDISFFVNAQHIELWCLLHSSDDFDLLVYILNLFQEWAPMD